jgi:hypothetical protein
MKINKFEIYNEIDVNKFGISNFPCFPYKETENRFVFNQLEIKNFNKKDIPFPLRIELIERIVDIYNNNIEFFTLRNLFDIIEKDKNRFINTNTFLKIELDYINQIKSRLSIKYYTIKDDGDFMVCSFEELFNIISPEFNSKKFLKKIIKKRKEKYDNIPYDVEFIPILPILWLEYDENNNLIYFKHFSDLKNEFKPQYLNI